MALLGQRFRAGAQRFNGLLGRFIPPNNAGGLLSADETGDAQRQAQLALAANLLNASGPSPMPISFGQALGSGLIASQQAQSGAIDSALTRRLLAAQLNPPPKEDRTPTLIAELTALGLPMTVEGVKQLAEARGPQGTTINIGKEDEIIPINQLPNVRLPDGSTPPLGTTLRQAREMGATVKSSAEQQKTAQTESAIGVLDELEQLALGPGGVFTDVEPGLLNRAGSAVEHIGNMVTQNSPQASRYEDLSKGSLAPIIKSLGESGALADGDVQRAMGLLPRAFPLPDTKEVAKQKFAALREILQRGLRNRAAGIVVEDDLPPLPDGFTLDESTEEP